MIVSWIAKRSVRSSWDRMGEDDYDVEALAAEFSEDAVWDSTSERGGDMPAVKVGDINMYYETEGRAHRCSGHILFNQDDGRRHRGADGCPWSPSSPHPGRIDGGCIAQELTINYPLRTRSLILVDTMPVGTHGVNVQAMNGMVAAPAERISRKTHVMLQLPYMFTAGFLQDPAMVQMALDAMVGNPYPQPAYAFARHVAAILKHDTSTRLARITAPTLVLVGREDIAQPVKLYEQLAAGIPNAKLVVQDGGAHAFFAELPDKFNQAVLDFLAQVA